jgi:hypothetical protein
MMRSLCLFVSSWEYLFAKLLKGLHFAIIGLERKLPKEFNFSPLIKEYEMAEVYVAGLELIRYVVFKPVTRQRPRNKQLRNDP